MSRIVYLNGSFVPFEEARIPIMDRGFLFADGIYEVSAVLNGRLVDHEAHLARLDRSLAEIRIANPYSAAEWTRLQEELVRRNGLAEGLVYMQVTRGVAERDFAFPKEAEPTVMMFTQVKSITRSPAAETGVAVVTVPDLRWKRRDIKSVALLAQVLAKQAAAEAGVFEAWMVEDGYVTEGSSSTAFIVTTDGGSSRVRSRTRSCRVLRVLRCCGSPRRPASRWKSGHSRSRRRSQPRRHFLPAHPASSCPWWRSTGSPSAAAQWGRRRAG